MVNFMWFIVIILVGIILLMAISMDELRDKIHYLQAEMKENEDIVRMYREYHDNKQHTRYEHM